MSTCPKCGFALTGIENECPNCGVILMKARAVPPRPPVASAPVPVSPPRPRGVGGLLLLFMLLQSAGILYLIWKDVAVAPALFFDARAFDAFDRLSPILTFVIRCEIAFELVQVVGGLAGLVLIFIRASRTAFYWRLFLSLLILATALDFWAGSVLPEYIQPFASPTQFFAAKRALAKAQGQNIVSAGFSLLWLIYWSISLRVKNTFVTKQPQGVALDAKVFD